MKQVRDLGRGAAAAGPRRPRRVGANFLVLDEPTNHLDLDSRETLEAALEGFPGTVLLVSHDRALIDAVAHRTAAIEDGTVRIYDGGWADLVRAREERAEPPRSPPEKADQAQTGREAAARLDPLAEIEAEIERSEREVARLEEARSRLDRRGDDRGACRAEETCRPSSDAGRPCSRR